MLRPDEDMSLEPATVGLEENPGFCLESESGRGQDMVFVLRRIFHRTGGGRCEGYFSSGGRAFDNWM